MNRGERISITITIIGSSFVILLLYVGSGLITEKDKLIIKMFPLFLLINL